MHSGEYSLNKKVSVKTPMLQLDLFDYSDAYIAVKGRISVTVTGTDTVQRQNKKLTFKNNVPFSSCIYI